MHVGMELLLPSTLVQSCSYFEATESRWTLHIHDPSEVPKGIFTEQQWHGGGGQIL